MSYVCTLARAGIRELLEANALEQVEAGGPSPRMHLKTVNTGAGIQRGSRAWCRAGVWNVQEPRAKKAGSEFKWIFPGRSYGLDTGAAGAPGEAVAVPRRDWVSSIHVPSTRPSAALLGRRKTPCWGGTWRHREKAILSLEDG